MLTEAQQLADWASASQDPDAASALAERFIDNSRDATLATQLMALGYLVGALERSAPRRGVVGAAVLDLARHAAAAIDLLMAKEAGNA